MELKNYTAAELAEIIEKHGKWLDDEIGGERADLSYARLDGARLDGASLVRARLDGASLNGASLDGARLDGASLNGASLNGARLDGASLVRARLDGARLDGASLNGASLDGASLDGASLVRARLDEVSSFNSSTGNMAQVKSIQCDLWAVTYTDTIMQIGCQKHLIAEWWKFSDAEISAMDYQALDWWKIWKPILRKIIKVSPATPTGA